MLARCALGLGFGLLRLARFELRASRVLVLSVDRGFGHGAPTRPELLVT
jgi:hypothetical protein